MYDTESRRLPLFSSTRDSAEKICISLGFFFFKHRATTFQHISLSLCHFLSMYSSCYQIPCSEVEPTVFRKPLCFSVIHRMKSKHISTAIIAYLFLVPIYLSCFSRNCPKSGPPRSVNKRYQVCCISVPRVTNNTLNRGGRLI